jgi:hypothetical protein
VRARRRDPSRGSYVLGFQVDQHGQASQHRHAFVQVRLVLISPSEMLDLPDEVCCWFAVPIDRLNVALTDCANGYLSR